jgi:hypothetical protein
VWLIILSDQLPIVALVGRYPPNQLIGRGPLSRRLSAFPGRPTRPDACGLNPRFREVSPTARQVIHVLLTRPPLANWPKPAARPTCMCYARRQRLS